MRAMHAHLIKNKTATPDQCLCSTKYLKHPLFTTPAFYQPNTGSDIDRNKSATEDLLR